jgi:hypothetical protein
MKQTEWRKPELGRAVVCYVVKCLLCRKVQYMLRTLKALEIDLVLATDAKRV